MDTTKTTLTKEVKYDRETRDFCALVNGEIIGWAASHLEAHRMCDDYVYEYLTRDNVTAADLTPEEAADVLAGFLEIDADYAAAMEAEALEFLLAEEARAGVTDDDWTARASRHTRRARKYGRRRGAFTAAQWKVALSHYGGRCLACGTADGLTIDHVIPLALGGKNTIMNLQPLCLACNFAKGCAPTDYRDPARVASLRLFFHTQTDERRAARVARLDRIANLYAWCWLSARGASISPIPRFDTPLTSITALAADLDARGIGYDDDSLGALFAAVGNVPGHVVTLHMGFEWLCQLRAAITMGALVLGWRGCDDLAVYVEEQMAAAGVDFSLDLPSAEHVHRAAPLVAAGMGPIDAYWQAVEDWEDENLAASEEQREIREGIRELRREA